MDRKKFKTYLVGVFGYKGAWYRFNNIQKMRWHEIQKINDETNIPFEALKDKYSLKSYFFQQERKQSESNN